MKDHQILPRISFEPNKPRTLKIIKRKREKFTNTDGDLVDGIKYLVLENGEAKTFFTASQTLISKLADIPNETIVKITQKKVRDGGMIKTTYDVSFFTEEGEAIIEDNDIPVIEEEEIKE